MGVSTSGETLELLHQLFWCLFVGRILGDTVHWANVDTLWGVIVAYTLGAQVRVDLIDLFTL
jgi:hypothetical protein